MRRTFLHVTVALLIGHASANAATFVFDTDPFAGSDALTTPGRQIVGGEPSITFNIGTDVFLFVEEIFGVTTINFANDLASNLPTSGVNTVVLRSFDNDANPATPFGAGNAANLIADQITAPGAGFFVYFNSGLDLARLVFSTDLNDNTADLKVLARMTNLSGQAGRDAFPSFTAGNFDTVPVPEPATLLLMTSAGVFSLGRAAVRRVRRRAQ